MPLENESESGLIIAEAQLPEFLRTWLHGDRVSNGDATIGFMRFYTQGEKTPRSIHIGSINFCFGDKPSTTFRSELRSGIYVYLTTH